MVKKWIGWLMGIVLAVTVLALPASARTTHANSYAVTGYAGSETDVFAPSGDDVYLFNMDTEEWDFLGDAMHVRRYMQNGYYMAYAIIDTDECSGETVFSMDLADNLSDYGVICFGIGVTSLMGADVKPMQVELELYDDGGNCVTSTLYLQLDVDSDSVNSIKWNMVFFDISDFEGRNDAAELHMTIKYDLDSPPSVLRISNPYAIETDAGGFTYAEKYLTNLFTASVGIVGMRSGAVRPDERGQANLSGAFIVPEQPKEGADAFLEIQISRVTSGGLTIGVGFDSGTTEYLNRVNLTSNDGESEVFTVPFRVKGDVSSFELMFDSVVCDTYLKIESIKLHYIDDVPIMGNSDIGQVNSLTRDGSSVVFSGVMEREAVKEFADFQLHFYAIPGWSCGDLATAVDVGQMKVTTRFEYTADLSAYPALADTYMFFAAVMDTDGKLLPLSAPAYTDDSDIQESALSNIGLYGASSVGVFESNVSHVIVDVPLDQLLAPTISDVETVATSLSYSIYDTTTEEGLAEEDAGSVSVIAARTETVTVNHALLKQLDSDINFYISAGIEVYLRITSDSKIPGLTYPEQGAYNYAVLPDTAEAIHFYTAIVRFLCKRYSGIGGIIIGKEANLGLYTGGGIDAENAAHYAKELAALCRLTYNAASTVTPDILIVLPFGEFETDGNELFQYVDPKTLSVMASLYLEKMGGAPWVMMYCFDSTNDILSDDMLQVTQNVPQNVKRLTDDLGLEGSAAVMYYYEPLYADIVAGENYNESLARTFAELCGSVKARAVFLSLKNLTAYIEHNFYSYLKNAENLVQSEVEVKSLRAVFDYVAEPVDAMADKLENTVGSYLLWDFTDKFYPLDWIAGGGVSSCTTVYSDLFSLNQSESGRYARVLRSVVSCTENGGYYGSGVSGAAGISLCNFSRTVDMSGIDYVEFTFALNQADESSAENSGTVVFVIGSDDFRAEFDVETVEYGKVLRYVCDLSSYEYRSSVNYAGIMVYAEEEVYFDLSSVRVYSDALADAELAGVFEPAEEDESRTADPLAIVFCSTIVFILSICAAVLLTRHDAEDLREREKKMREEKHLKRERAGRNYR